jgi:hypothetical protein
MLSGDITIAVIAPMMRRFLKVSEALSICSNLNCFPGLRSEWAKSKARADRWSEEVILVVEEMRRVLCYFDWKACWWESQAQARPDVHQDIASGLVAYAAKQADVMRGLAVHFAAMWWPILQKNDIEISWPQSYVPSAMPSASLECDDENADHWELDDVDFLDE